MGNQMKHLLLIATLILPACTTYRYCEWLSNTPCRTRIDPGYYSVIDKEDVHLHEYVRKYWVSINLYCDNITTFDMCFEAGQIDDVIELIRTSSAVTSAQEEAEGFARKAKEALTSLPESPFKETLLALADYVVIRRW